MSSVAAKETSAHQGLFARLGLGRWFSWRRKRFWLITLPIGFVLSTFLALWCIYLLPNPGKHEWKIGQWTRVKIDGEDETDNVYSYRSREINIGPMMFFVTCYTEPNPTEALGFHFDNVDDKKWNLKGWNLYWQDYRRRIGIYVGKQ